MSLKWIVFPVIPSAWLSVSVRKEDVRIPFIYKSLDAKGFNIVTNDTEVIEEIKQDPEVSQVYEDRLKFPTIHYRNYQLWYPHAQAKGDHYIDRIDADLSSIADIDGRPGNPNIDIAVLDTGVITNHPDLENIQSPRRNYPLTSCTAPDCDRFDDLLDSFLLALQYYKRKK